VWLNITSTSVGTLTNSGVAVAIDTWVTMPSLAGLTYTGSTSAGSDTLWVRAMDGTVWGLGSVSAILTDPGERAPVVMVGNATPTVSRGQQVTLASQFSASDPDNDPITQYQVWFTVPSNPTIGTVTLNGAAIALNTAVTVSSLSGLVYTGGTAVGTDLL